MMVSVLPQRFSIFFCNICKVRASDQVSIDQHYRGNQHKWRSGFLSHAFLNQKPTTFLKCAEDVFYHPSRKRTLIGLQYLKCPDKHRRGRYKCLLCGFREETLSIYIHLISIKHKKNYITRDFPFLFEQIPNPSYEHVEKIAVAIEAVEGITKLGTDIHSVQKSSESSSRQNIDRILEKLAEKGMHFESPNRTIETVQCLKTELCPSNRLEEKPLKQLKGTSIAACNQVSALQCFCNICNVSCDDPLTLKQHYLGGKHKRRSELLFRIFFNHLPVKSIMCVEDIYNYPNRKGTRIGLQYLKICTHPWAGPYYRCTLCKYNALNKSIFDHLVSLNHKQMYITKAFPFLFEQIPKPSGEMVEKIAEAVEAVEGITKFVTDHRIVKQPSDSSSKQIIDRLLEKLRKSGIHVQGPLRNIKGISTIVTNNRVSARPSRGHKRSQHSPFSSSPVSSSFTSPPGHFSLGYQIRTEDSPLPMTKAAELPYTGNMFQAMGHNVSEKHGVAQEHHLPVHQFSSSGLPPVYGPSDQNVNSGSGGKTHEIPFGYTHTIPNFVCSPYAIEGRARMQASTPSDAKDLQTMGTVSHSSSSITCPAGQCYTQGCSVEGSHSCCDSCASSESLFASPLCERSSSLGSRREDSLSQDSPSSTHGSCAQSLHVTDSCSTTKTHFSLSPDILKILHGKDIATVNNILTRLAEFCPPLQQVNISMLVDVLFEAGALGQGGDGAKN